ncbi:MAG: acyltransferase family protein [Myxococcales bacterium]|nr:acyltransferase family protein [Myxococcales bacterium]
MLPTVVRLIASLLPTAERERLKDLQFADAGHGFDPFGLHPDYVAFGEVITSPLYEKYFRVESSGHEHIPSSGPGVLAANHSGAIPFDSAMIWADVVRNTNPPRVPRPVADHFVPMIPVIGTIFARGGMVGGSRGNARTLLERGELLLIHPEGVPGIAKPFKQRYRLQDWRVGHVELAIRHGAPVIPVAVVGAEEQMPQIGKIPISIAGMPFIPITLTPLPLPVRYHIRYGAPIPVNELWTPSQADDPAVVKEAAALVKKTVQAMLDEGVRTRKGVFA